MSDIATIHVAGRTGSVSDEMDADLAACAGIDVDDVIRHAGATRIQTAIMIAEAFYSEPGGVALANGYVWPDAVAGANLSRALATPILLTANNAQAGLEAEVTDYAVGALGPADRPYVLGQEGVMAIEIEDDFEQALP